MPTDLHNYSDEALLAEVARRLRTSTSYANAAGAEVVALHVRVPAVEVPGDLAGLRYDSEAIRQLLEANSKGPGLRRCEIREAFRTAGREALHIDQKVQYLIGRHELIGEIGPDGRTYWRLAETG